MKTKVGDKVTWKAWGGETLSATVMESEENIKNNEAGFGADNGHWAYDSQLLTINGKAV